MNLQPGIKIDEMLALFCLQLLGEMMVDSPGVVPAARFVALGPVSASLQAPSGHAISGTFVFPLGAAVLIKPPRKRADLDGKRGVVVAAPPSDSWARCGAARGRRDVSPREGHDLVFSPASMMAAFRLPQLHP